MALWSGGGLARESKDSLTATYSRVRLGETRGIHLCFHPEDFHSRSLFLRSVFFLFSFEGRYGKEVIKYLGVARA